MSGLDNLSYWSFYLALATFGLLLSKLALSSENTFDYQSLFNLPPLEKINRTIHLEPTLDNLKVLRHNCPIDLLAIKQDLRLSLEPKPKAPGCGIM